MPQILDESDFRDSILNEEDFAQQSPNLELAAMFGRRFGIPPSTQENLARGFALQPPTPDAGFINRQINKAGNIAPPLLIGAAGEALAGPIGAAIGGSLARVGQQTASAYITGQANPINIGVDVAGSGLIQGASVMYKPEIESAIQSVGAGIKNLGARAYDYLATSKIGGGIAHQSWNYFKNNVESVLSKIGSLPEDADIMANDLRTTISNASQTLEDKYAAGVQALQASKNPIRINLDKNLGDPIRNVAHDMGYLDPNRNANSPQAGFFIKNILQRVNDLKSASPLDIYNFQKDLNSYISDNLSTNPSLGKALLQVKDSVRLFIEDHPLLKSIAQMNNAWTSAKTIDSMAKATTGANDLIGTIKRIFNNPQETLQKRAIESVGQQLPEFAQGIGNIRSYLAAQQVGPLFRGVPATGYAAGLGAAGLYGAQKIAENPYYAFATPLLAALSPRAYAYGYRTLQGIPTQAARFLPASTYAGRAALQSALPNYLATPMTPQSINNRINNINNPFK